MFSATDHEQMAAVFAELEASGFSEVVGIDDGSPNPLLRAFRLAEMPHPELTLFDIGSVTKTMTAAAIVRLASAGRLSFEQSLGQFFDLPSALAGITIDQLLTHSSGLADFLAPLGEPREYALEQDYKPLSRDELLRQVRRSRLLAAPGERWSYSNVGYSLLAAIVEVATGAAFETHLRQELLVPLGMRDTSYTVPLSEQARVASGRLNASDWGRPTDKARGPSWNLIGNGGMISTVADLLRWRTAFCSLLVDACPAPVVVEPPIASGYGCFVRRSESELGDVVYHNGANGVFSATIRWFPKLGHFLAVVASDSQHSALPIARRIAACWIER